MWKVTIQYARKPGEKTTIRTHENVEDYYEYLMKELPRLRHRGVKVERVTCQKLMTPSG